MVVTGPRTAAARVRQPSTRRPLTSTVQATDDEVVIFSWITYDSRAQRDEVNAKVMADPRLKAPGMDMPFDGKRLIHGGFETFLEM